MGKVIQLHSPVATCPQCGCQEWFIHVNGFYDDHDKITKYECTKCGFSIDIEVVMERVDDVSKTNT